MEGRDLERYVWTHFMSNKANVCSISKSLMCWRILKDVKTHAVTVLYSNSCVIDHDE